MQLKSLKDQERLSGVFIMKEEQQHLLMHKQSVAENNLCAGEAAQRVLIANTKLEDLKTMNREIRVIHEHELRTLISNTA